VESDFGWGIFPVVVTFVIGGIFVDLIEVVDGAVEEIC
jgi:hypothetical protein